MGQQIERKVSLEMDRAERGFFGDLADQIIEEIKSRGWER